MRFPLKSFASRTLSSKKGACVRVKQVAFLKIEWSEISSNVIGLLALIALWQAFIHVHTRVEVVDQTLAIWESARVTGDDLLEIPTIDDMPRLYLFTVRVVSIRQACIHQISVRYRS
jgi:hypothetical protein